MVVTDTAGSRARGRVSLLIEDAMFGWPRRKPTTVEGPPKVVILGGGYGGVYAALGLRRAARKGQIELSLVSRDNFFLYQPMLAEVVSGSIEPPHIVIPIRKLLPGASFYQADIERVDVELRNVEIRYPGHTHFHNLPYDHLIVSVGSATDLSRLSGMAEHAFPFKTMGDALFLRNHVIGVLERAEVEPDPEQRQELLTFVVAGGSYTGVEVAAEINDFVKEAAETYPHVDTDAIKVILLQAGDRILPELSEKLAQFSGRLLHRRGVEIRLNTRIRGATAQTAILDDMSTIPTRTLVAAMGSAPNRLLDTLPFARGPRGRLKVDETLAVPDPDFPGIWALGDCAAVPDLRSGGTCPPTAQFAVREAKAVARNVLASIRGEKPRPFSYRSLGVFVPLGRFSAAAEVLGFKVAGFPAWWLYRTYYLFNLPRLERRVRVAIDWTLDLVFRRDIVQLDGARSQGVSRAHYEPGDVIFRQDELARNFYVVVEGQVQVSRREDGLESEVAVLGSGEYFGEMSLLSGGRHTASVTALTPVDLVVMNSDDFTALVTSSTRIEELLTSVMRQRLSSGGATTPTKR